MRAGASALTKTGLTLGKIGYSSKIQTDRKLTMPWLPPVAMPWRPKEKNAEKLYGAIVAQARLPVFYQEFGVPDTLEGRFVVLSLNLFAVLHRLKGEDAQGKALSQDLADQFKDDMETVLRELGISDLRIPKKMRGLASVERGSAAEPMRRRTALQTKRLSRRSPRPCRPAARRQRLLQRLSHTI